MRIVSCSSTSGRSESPWSLIDGRRDTYWHSRWREPVAEYPHDVVISLGVDSMLRGFTVTPRQGRTSSRVRKMAFYLSEDGRNWPETPDCTLSLADEDNEHSVLLPEPRKARFFKMVCLEPISKGEAYAAVAEVKPMVESVVGEYPPYAFFSINYVSSDLPGEGPASNVLDGNPDTYWHTMKGVTMASFPHDIRINLGSERRLRGMLYRGAPSPQGRVKDYEVYVSHDGKNWGEPVARGTFSNSAEMQEAIFFTPVDARFIRLVALSAHDGGDSAAVSELDVIPAE